MTIKKSKIAYFTILPTPYRQPLLQRLTEQADLEVHIYFMARSEADRSWTVEVTGDRMHFLPVRTFSINRGKPLFFHFNRNVETVLKKQQFDLVIVPGWAQPTSIRALRWCGKNGVPTAVHSETHRLGYGPPGLKGNLKHRVVARILSGVTGGLAVGSAARDYLTGFGIPKKRIWLFPNTPDIEGIVEQVNTLKPERQKYLADLKLDCTDIALFVGRLIPAKAPLDLLRAYRRLTEIRADTGLLIVGDGELRQKMVDYIQKHKLENVRLLGFKEGRELWSAYAAADLFVLPSRQEPWGAVVNEAAAAGLPLLVSDIVGAGLDLVRDGLNGYRVAAGDIPALTDCWNKILTSEKRAEMGKQSQELVRGWGYDFAIEQFRNCCFTLLENQ